MSISQILHDKFMAMVDGTIGIKASNLPLEIVTGAVAIIDSDHAYIHQKKKYSAFLKQSIAAGGTLVFCFKTPATKYVHYRPAQVTPSADKVDLQIFEGAVFTAATGTLLENTNRNRNEPLVSGVELRSAPTVTTNGTLLPGFSAWLPGSTGIGQSRSGDVSGGDDEIVFKQNTTYRFVATNGSSVANVIGFRFNWYEEEA